MSVMRQRPWWLTCIAVIALLAAACTGGSSPAPSSAAPSAPQSAPASASSSPSASAAAGLQGKELAIVNWGFDNYQQAQANWFKKLATEQGAASVQIIDGKIDPQVQAKAIDDLIAKGIDGMIFQPVEPVAAVTSIDSVQKASIPIALICNRPDPSTGTTAPAAICNESASTEKAGESAGNWLKENKPGEKAKVVIFDILTVPLCHDLRMDGFVKGLTSVMGAENVEIKFRDTVEHRREVALAKMEDLLQRDPDFNVFTACGAEGVLGGIEALERAGRAKAVDKNPQTEWILTIDGSPPELERLFNKSSSVVATITLTPKENATAALDLLTKVVTGALSPTDATVVDLPGIVLPTSCEEAAPIFQEQYGLNDGFTPLDCSKFK